MQKGRILHSQTRKKPITKVQLDGDKGLNWVVAMITKQDITETRNVVY